MIINEKDVFVRKQFPAISLCRSANNSKFVFNKHAQKFITSERMSVSTAYINEDKYILFKNIQGPCGNKVYYSGSSAAHIPANGILTSLGLLATDHSFIGRKCLKIKDGLAVKLY